MLRAPSGEITSPHPLEVEVFGSAVHVVAAHLGDRPANNVGVAGVGHAVDEGIVTGLRDFVTGNVGVRSLAQPAQPGGLEWGETLVHVDGIALVDALSHRAGVEMVVHDAGPLLVGIVEFVGLGVPHRLIRRDGRQAGVLREGLVPLEVGEAGVPLLPPVVGRAEDGFAHRVWRRGPHIATNSVGRPWDGTGAGA